ncbi:MAG: NUDIX domain-containing protein [Woeseiaceae bacterium]|nr:NUDIX domain-containing protein [Woeseiaceae bacterium]
MLPTDLTVAAVVERHDSFLIVEKRVSGRFVLSQPSAHVEASESPEQAIVRGALEETGYEISVGDLLGIYLWIHPQTRRQYLRVAYAATFIAESLNHVADEHIKRVHWLSLGDIRQRANELVSPIVQRCVEDYLVGKRESSQLLNELLPIQQNIVQVMANACLV